jgi:hypothetical protein
MYLGEQLEYQGFNGIMCWAISWDKYINAAIENIEKKLKSEGRHLFKRVDTPMSSDYGPEEDTSVQLEGTDYTYFQESISILRWTIELGRIALKWQCYQHTWPCHEIGI